MFTCNQVRQCTYCVYTALPPVFLLAAITTVQLESTKVDIESEASTRYGYTVLAHSSAHEPLTKNVYQCWGLRINGWFIRIVAV